MKKLVFSLLLLLLSISSFGQMRVVGVVLFKEDSTVFPNANILVKGTGQRTITDRNGFFSLEIPNRSARLKIGQVGYQPQTIRVHSSDSLIIALKPKVFVDYFYKSYVGIGLSSGFPNTPAGLELDLFHRFIQLQVSYQTNFHSNSQIQTAFTFHGVLSNSDYKLDAQITNDRIVVGKDFFFNSYKGNLNLNIRSLAPGGIAIIAGAGYADRNFPEKQTSSVGFTLGAGTSFNIGVPATMFASTTYWQNYWQFESGVCSDYRRWKGSMSYNKVGSSFHNLNLKLGYLIFY